MDDEAKFWLTILVAILLAVVLMGLGCTFINCWHMHRMAELGYEERIVPGRQSTLWQKLPQPVRYECDCPKVTPLVSITNYVQEVESYWTTNRFDILETYIREQGRRALETVQVGEPPRNRNESPRNYDPLHSFGLSYSNGFFYAKED